MPPQVGMDPVTPQSGGGDGGRAAVGRPDRRPAARSSSSQFWSSAWELVENTALEHTVQSRGARQGWGLEVLNSKGRCTQSYQTLDY